jgi:hypothetical protein
VTSVEGRTRRQFIEATDTTALAYDFRISANRQRHFYLWDENSFIDLLRPYGWGDFGQINFITALEWDSRGLKRGGLQAIMRPGSLSKSPAPP